MWGQTRGSSARPRRSPEVCPCISISGILALHGTSHRESVRPRPPAETQPPQVPAKGEWQKVEPLVLDSINGIISQRLVRTICPSCREVITISEQDLELIRWLTANEEHVGSFPIYAVKGCQDCMGTGYSGQTGIFEMIKFDKLLKQSLLDAQPLSSFKLRQSLADMPVETLKQQGLRKILDGITSLEEIRRVIFYSAVDI